MKMTKWSGELSVPPQRLEVLIPGHLVVDGVPPHPGPAPNHILPVKTTCSPIIPSLWVVPACVSHLIAP